MSKSEAIHVGSLKGPDFKPFQNDALMWKENSFRYLGVQFSLNTKSLYELNFVPKLTQIQHTLNFWRSRSLSLIGKVTVIKSLLLPQLLLFIFCVVYFYSQIIFQKIKYYFL